MYNIVLLVKYITKLTSSYRDHHNNNSLKLLLVL